MSNGIFKRVGWLAVGLVPGLSLAMDAAPGLDGLCDNVEFDIQAGQFEVGALQAWRGPFDFDGARIVGCLRNNGEEEITELTLVYDQIQSRGGGGGGGDLELAPLGPGQTGLFATSTFGQDAEHLERWGITGLRLRELQVPTGWEQRTESDGSVSMDMAHDSHAFEPRPELDYPLIALPESELAANCKAAEPAAGELGVSQLQALRFADGKHRLVGCFHNGSDQAQADGFNHQVSVGYSIESAGIAGGWGNLRLAGPVPPGRSALFVSSFDLKDPNAAVTISFR